MQNIIQQQDDLKNLSQQQLVTAMQTGTYPQFLVLSELNRRKRMADDQARREAADDTTTVAQEVVNAAGVPQGGIAQLAGAMNAKTDNTQNTGIEELIPKQPVRMKEGGTPQYKNRYEMLMAYLFGRDDDEEKEKPREGASLAEMINFGGDYEPVKKAEGGVVKAQPGGIMSNIMSLMSPPSYDVAGLSKPRVAQEPEMTALEALETIPPDAARALEISKKIQVGKSVKKVLKEAGLTGLEALNLIAGAGAYISLDTAYKSLNAIGTLFDDDEARVIFDMAKTLEDRQTDKLFKKHGNWLQRNLPRLNPNFAYTFDDREKAAEQLSAEELEAIRKRSEAAIRSAAEEGGDKTVFAEGTPSVPITGTYTLPRPLDQVGSPMIDAPTKPVVGQRTAADLITAPQVSTVNDAIKTVSGSSMQSTLPSVSSIIKPPLADDPFRLEGAAKKEQLRNILSDPSITGIPDYLDKVQNEENIGTDFRKDLRDRMLDLDISRRSMEEYFPSGDDPRSKAIADLNRRALQFLKTDTYTPPSEIYSGADIYGPELQGYFEQILENQQKAMPGGGGRSGLGALFAQTLENQQEGIPGGTDPNAKPTLQSRFDRAKLYLEGLGQDIRGMTQEDVINLAKSTARKAGDVIDGLTTKVVDEFTRIQNNKESKAFDAEDVAVGSEPPNFKAINKATAEQLAEEQDATDTASQSQIDKLMELLNKQQSAIDKQSGASSAALSEYLSGLEKDREFDKAMALANAGAALMMPSATIGEGFGKAIQAGTKTLQTGKDSYNKNKLQVLALQGRIDAAKAAAANRAAISGATVSSRILLARREELADQLERIAPLGTNPEGPLADRAAALRKAIKETDDQLNALITTASIGSTPTGSDIFASYNLTG